MVKNKKKNNMGNAFNLFEWNVPHYGSPEEVIRALEATNYRGKEIKSIKIIGECGIGEEDNYAIEPTQIIFKDGSTLEILPLNKGGARIGLNSIPVVTVDGWNHSNCDSKTLFSNAEGKKLKYITIEHTAKTKYTADIVEYGRQCHHNEYCINIVLNNHINIKLISYGGDTGESYQFEIWEDYQKVPYERIRDAEKEVEQWRILPGSWTGYDAMHLLDKHQKLMWYLETSAISVCGHGWWALWFYLEKYLDPKIQSNEKVEFVEDKTYLYRISTIKEMLQDMREDLARYKKNPDSDEFNHLREHDVSTTMDFYERFVKVMECFMLTPNAEYIIMGWNT